jgi:hypothetical protein
MDHPAVLDHVDHGAVLGHEEPDGEPGAWYHAASADGEELAVRAEGEGVDIVEIRGRDFGQDRASAVSGGR